MTLLSGRLGSSDLSTVSHALGEDHLITDLECHGVVVNGVCTVDGHRLCRHGGGYILPTVEGVTLLGRCLGCNNLSSVCYFTSLYGLSVCSEGECILIYSIGTSIGNVLCRNSSCYLTPIGEGVTLLSGSLGCSDFSSVSHALCKDYLFTDLECHGVVVNGVCTVDGHRLCRHGGGYILPTVEGVTLLGRCLGCNNLSSVCYFTSLYGLSVCSEGECILIYSIGTSIGNVLCRNSSCYLTPIGEGVTLLSGSLGCSDFSSVSHALCKDYLFTDLECHGVVVHGVATCDGDVLARHGSRNILPTVEGVTLLGRSCRCFYCCAVENGLLGDCLSVNNECGNIGHGLE